VSKPGDHERRWDEILGHYLAAASAGQVPDQQELIAGHPDLAVELAAFFADSDRLRHLANPLRPIAQAAQGGPSTEPAPDVTDADALAESPPPATRTADRPLDGPTARLAPTPSRPTAMRSSCPKGRRSATSATTSYGASSVGVA
jgi:hypothetical protein